ncbi:MAG: Uncharacterized protein XD91_1843 [Clostridiales bacterium 38_11]|nr:MAG: Uncharacterized protein XD91_1843 [Clostridiales bacterium 38_11]
MECWIRPEDNSGTYTGVNDSSIYTFKERKYESLAREILQNSLDERLFDDTPIRVEFKLFNLKTNDIPGIRDFKELFADSLQYWIDDNQENGRVFFKEALSLLGKDMIKVLRISDFNTNGVLGSGQRFVNSSADITPWFNLVKSEGSSSKGDNQGGSFGIGKNATFANSALRTVFYSTFDKENVKAYEGIVKLATSYKSNKQYAPKAFYGSKDNGKSNAIENLLSLDFSFKRTVHGTDIFILGFEEEDDWEIRMLTSILSDFIIPIKQNNLEVILESQKIDSNTIEMIFKEKIKYCIDNGMESLKDDLRNSHNYYCILTSDETKIFVKEFDNLGKAVLNILYSPDFERKIMRTRETGMKLFTRSSISSSIGFAGIVKLEGQNLSRLFRKMENPAHTTWSPDNVSNLQEKKQGKRLLNELDHWMKQQVVENATDKNAEQIDVVGLGDYLPAELNEQSATPEQEQETVSNSISEISVKTPDREAVIKQREIIEELPITANQTDDNEPGVISIPSDDENDSEGGQGTETEHDITDGEQEMFKKVPIGQYKPRIIKQYDNYVLVINPQNTIKGGMLKIFISGETSNSSAVIIDARNKETGEIYQVNNNRIKIGDLKSSQKIKLDVKLLNNNDYALEVELHENRQ